MEKELTKSIELQEEVVRLLVLLLKKGETQQSSLITQMSGIGFRTGRIAELLGTTSNTVNVTIQKAKKKK